MAVNRDTLERYAFAYIKKYGNSNVRRFLYFINQEPNLTWSKEGFIQLCERFSVDPNRQQHSSGQGDESSPSAGSQFNIHIIQSERVERLGFWDYLLLNNLISSFRSNPNVTNVTNVNYGGSHQNSQSQNSKDRKEERGLLALGIVATVLTVIFHVSICYFYNKSKEKAEKNSDISYLDNKLKMFRNLEFAVSSISLVALVTCAVYTVVPPFALILLGLNSLVCFFGGLAFHSKHEEELEQIEKAKSEVANSPVSFQQPYMQHNDGFDNPVFTDDRPPPYSAKGFDSGFSQQVPTAPPAYQPSSRLDEGKSYGHANSLNSCIRREKAHYL